MKYIQSLLAVSLLVMTVGCIKENMDDCYKRGMSFLYFDYKGDGLTDILNKKIKQVALYVYDESNRFITKKNVSQNELVERHGTNLDLEPGKYQVVCVGNPFDQTEIREAENSGIVDFSKISISHPNLYNPDNIPGNDSLYLGRFCYEISGLKENQADTVPFESSHLKVYMEVRGVNSIRSRAPEPSVAVTFRNVSPAMNFENKTVDSEKTDYVPEFNFDAVNGTMISRFNILRHDLDNSIEVVLYDKENDMKVLASFFLSDFLKEHPSIDVSKQEVLIPILVEFKGLIVTIKVPGWSIVEL